MAFPCVFPVLCIPSANKDRDRHLLNYVYTKEQKKDQRIEQFDYESEISIM